MILFVCVWRWGWWLVTVLMLPLILVGYWLGLFAMYAVMCPLLLCIGKPRMVREVAKETPLMPPNLREHFVLPRTGLAERVVRAVVRWW